MGGHGYSSLLVCYPRRAWAATGIVVCWSIDRKGRDWKRITCAEHSLSAGSIDQRGK